MTPKEYLRDICEPCVAEFAADPTSIRRAWVAVIALLHFEDYLARYRKSKIRPIRDELIRGFGHFQVIEDIGNASKHFEREASSPRRGLSVRDYRIGKAAAFSDGSYWSDGSSWAESPDVVRIEFNGEIVDVLHLCQACLKYLESKT